MKAIKCIKCGRAHKGLGAHCPTCLPEGIKACGHCGTLTPREQYCETCEAHGWENPSKSEPKNKVHIAGEDIYINDLVHPKVPANQHKYNRHHEICQQLNKTYIDKNIAYGDSFGKTFRELGIISAVTRMDDKMSRIKALVTGAENKVKDEALQDTLLDLANYCMMTVIEMEENKSDK